MACIVGGMLIGFTLAGLFLIKQGLGQLLLTARRRRYLVRGEGMVKRVERQSSMGAPKGRRGERAFRPVIIFADRDGRLVEFRSALGDVGKVSRFRTGQTVPVAYDPAGELPPRIASWGALWGLPLAQAAGGLAFLAGAAMGWLAFGDRLGGG